MRVWAGHRYTMIAVEYSRGRGGIYPKPVGQVSAALGCVLDHAPELRVDPSVIALAGYSAGAHLAAQVALLTPSATYARALRKRRPARAAGDRTGRKARAPPGAAVEPLFFPASHAPLRHEYQFNLDEDAGH